MKTMFALFALALAVAPPAQASRHTADGGQVSVPLSDYTALVNQPRPAPVAYAIGRSSVEAVVRDRDGRKSATVEVTVQIEIFEDEWTLAPVLPAGTVIHITAWHDNTAEGRGNPDPTQWVGWGQRSYDEMYHAHVNVTYLTDEDYEQIVADRRARRPTID